MKIILGEETCINVQGTSLDIQINARAMSDDEQILILERTLTYGVNTVNEGWRETAVQRLKEQAIEFKNDAQVLVDVQNQIRNISVDIEAELP